MRYVRTDFSLGLTLQLQLQFVLSHWLSIHTFPSLVRSQFLGSNSHFFSGDDVVKRTPVESPISVDVCHSLVTTVCLITTAFSF